MNRIRVIVFGAVLLAITNLACADYPATGLSNLKQIAVTFQGNRSFDH